MSAAPTARPPAHCSTVAPRGDCFSHSRFRHPSPVRTRHRTPHRTGRRQHSPPASRPARACLRGPATLMVRPSLPSTGRLTNSRRQQSEVIRQHKTAETISSRHTTVTCRSTAGNSHVPTTSLFIPSRHTTTVLTEQQPTYSSHLYDQQTTTTVAYRVLEFCLLRFV